MNRLLVCVFSVLFASAVIIRGAYGFFDMESDMEERSAVIASLEKMKQTEGDIVTALLAFIQNAGAIRSFVLAGDSVRRDHEKCMRAADEQIGRMRERSSAAWRRFAVSTLFDVIAVSAIVYILCAAGLPSKKVRRPARHNAHKKKPERGE